jgi:hypothetical protein
MAGVVGMAAAVAIGIGLFAAPPASAQRGAVATLSVLVQPVERVAHADGAREVGVDGANLAEGDRVRTGDVGVALITFLDGSTVTVQPGSDVLVQQGNRRARGGIRLLIDAGRVWARVARGAGGGLSLASNEYAATAHDGLIGAERTADGGLVCWTRRGEVRLTDRIGHSVAVLGAGQRARASQGNHVTPEPFRPSASLLEVRTEGPVVPLVRMPDGAAAAGFLALDAEVNQVFGALTEPRGRRGWLVEVPGGQAGPYTLILTGTGQGPFTVAVSARYAGLPVYRQEITGDAAPGARLFTRITQGVDGADPRSARVREARFGRLEPWDAREPVLATPAAPSPGLN